MSINNKPLQSVVPVQTKTDEEERVEEPVPSEEHVSDIPSMNDESPRTVSIPETHADNGLVIRNVLSKTFGVLAKNEITNVISNIIFRNEVLPIQATKQYYLVDDYQKELVVEIYENFSTDESEISQVDGEMIGSFTLQLPIEANRNTVVDVTFTADSEGILTATAECLGQRKEYTVDSDIIMSPEEIEHSKLDMI
jgi:molecular chaperone DnaK (HSP70)